MSNEDITECLTCGVEPEVMNYYRNTATGERCGYRCRCGAIVVNGILQAHSLIG